MSRDIIFIFHEIYISVIIEIINKGIITKGLNSLTMDLCEFFVILALLQKFLFFYFIYL